MNSMKNARFDRERDADKNRGLQMRMSAQSSKVFLALSGCLTNLKRNGFNYGSRHRIRVR
jgi:hypothetical protein